MPGCAELIASRVLALANACFRRFVFGAGSQNPSAGVLRATARLAIFDGDYLTTTVAIYSFDPLQRAVDAMIANFFQNPWLTRRLTKTLQAIGS